MTKTKRDKKIRFVKDLNIIFQFTTGNKEIHDFSQPLIDEEVKVMLQKPSTVYLMLTSLGVDTSQREILIRYFCQSLCLVMRRSVFILDKIFDPFIDHHLS